MRHSFVGGIDTSKMRVSFKVLIINNEISGMGIIASRYSVCVTRS
jgi:hypothetical protein